MLMFVQILLKTKIVKQKSLQRNELKLDGLTLDIHLKFGEKVVYNQARKGAIYSEVWGEGAVYSEV